MKIVFAISLIFALVAFASAGRVPMAKRLEHGSWKRIGRASGEHKLQMHWFLRQGDLDGLHNKLMDVSDPDSPNYGQWLSTQEADAFARPNPKHILAVLKHLKNHGVDVATQARACTAGDILEVDVTVEQAERLLDTEFHSFVHVDDKTIVTRVFAGYSLPDEVAEAVYAVTPTTRFPPKLRLQVTKVNDPQVSSVTPSVLRGWYNVGDYAATKGSLAIASFLGQYFSTSDLQTFFATYAPKSKGRTYTLDGSNSGFPGTEAELDSQYAAAMGNGVPDLTAFNTAGQQPGNPENEPFSKYLMHLASLSTKPSVISHSYGDNEYSVVPSYQTAVDAQFQKITSQGVTLTFSSGDGGVSGGQSESCPGGKFVPTWPAQSLYVTAVGGHGTDPTIAADLSSGGFSNRIPRPSYQDDAVKTYLSTASGVPDSSLWNQTGAGIPDIAAGAINFLVCQGFCGLPVDGTSCASPSAAGVLALINDHRLNNGKSVLGYLNPLIYKKASTLFTGKFDIKQGSNPGCGTDGFPAAAGWDPVTGWGTIDFTAWTSLDF